MVKGVSSFGESVFCSISFEQMFPLEYFFPQHVLIKFLATLESIKAQDNVFKGSVDDIDIVLDIIDGLE